MNATPLLPDSRPKAVLQDLIDQHGRLTVLALALTTLLRPARKARDLSAVSYTHLIRISRFTVRFTAAIARRISRFLPSRSPTVSQAFAP